MKKVKNLIVPAFFIVIFSPIQAHAYLDAGSGSIVVQAIIAVFAGAAFAIKIYWRKLRYFFSKNKRAKTEKVEETKEENHGSEQ